MYIKKVVIENIRSISHFEMEFPKPAGWHVLIGDNGSGKTSVLQAMALGILMGRIMCRVFSDSSGSHGLNTWDIDKAQI